jgi:hypothetical protein
MHFMRCTRLQFPIGCDSGFDFPSGSMPLLYQENSQIVYAYSYPRNTGMRPNEGSQARTVAYSTMNFAQRQWRFPETVLIGTDIVLQAVYAAGVF